MSTHLNANRLSARYAWPGCSTISPTNQASPRITPMRRYQRGDRASSSKRFATGQNTTLKYFVKKCCNGLCYMFQFLQYFANLSRFAKSLMSTTRSSHGAPSNIRLRKLQTTTPYRLWEQTVQVISEVAFLQLSEAFLANLLQTVRGQLGIELISNERSVGYVDRSTVQTVMSVNVFVPISRIATGSAITGDSRSGRLVFNLIK